jgi:hypothetical protein
MPEDEEAEATTTNKPSKGTKTMATKKQTPKAKATKTNASTDGGRVTDEMIVAAVKAAKASATQKEIADSLRAKGFIVNGKRVGLEMSRQGRSPSGSAEGNGKAAPVKAAPKKPTAKAAPVKSLKRDKVTMIPKAKAKTTAAKRKSTTAKRVTKRVR